ncbi:MAG: hypothetical protein ABFR47_07080, partial [Verrucomicrobiota bacterium]
MKVLTKVFLVSVVLALFAGCTSSGPYVPEVPPKVQAQLLDYFKLPGNKVFILAVAANGDYAFGYDYGRATLKEAGKAAIKMCDENRESADVFAKPYIYAVNDKVVYEEMIKKAHEEGVEDEREVQKKELLKTEEAPSEEAPVEEA